MTVLIDYGIYAGLQVGEMVLIEGTKGLVILREKVLDKTEKYIAIIGIHSSMAFQFALTQQVLIEEGHGEIIALGQMIDASAILEIALNKQYGYSDEEDTGYSPRLPETILRRQ